MPLLTKYLWDFGDGYTFSEESPYHAYKREDVYTVTLTTYTDYGVATTTLTVVVVAPILITISQFCLRYAVQQVQGMGWAECSGDDWVTPVDCLSIIDDNDVPRMLIEDENDGFVWEEATFDRVEFQKPPFVDKYYEENLRSAEFRWIASAGGVNEYYLDKADGGDPGYEEPKKMEIGNMDSPQGDVGTLGAGYWGYGDNDGLGYDTIYVRLPDNTDPDTKALGYVTGIFWTEIAGEEWYPEEVSNPSAEENMQEFNEFHWYTRPYEAENKGKGGYDSNGYRESQSFSLDVYKDGSIVNPFASVGDIPENGDILFSGTKIECRRLMPVFKFAASELMIVGRNLFKIIKPQAGSREERTFDREVAELALSNAVYFVGRNVLTPLLERVSGTVLTGPAGVGIGPDGIDGSALVVPAAGLNLQNNAVVGAYTFMFWRSTLAPVVTAPALPALVQVGATYSDWQLMYVVANNCPANIVLTQGLVSTIRIYESDVSAYLAMYYNSMRYDLEPKPFEPGF